MDSGQDRIHETPHGLHLDYSMDFRSRRLKDVTPTFLSPLLPRWVDNILPKRAPLPVGPPRPQLA